MTLLNRSTLYIINLLLVCRVRTLAALLLQELGARTLRVNLGTLAPRGSSYHQALQVMAEEWREAPGGGVRLVIYPDGTQGSESDMVRLMRIGALNAGLLTANGISDIDRAVTGLQSMPLMFRNFDEFDYVNVRMRPKIERRLEAKGFVVLFWVDAGWVRFFTKEPLVHPDGLKKMKMFVWSGDTDQISIMRDIGFHPVPLETNDILPGLQTGLIDVVSVPPFYALSLQVDRRAPNMLDLNWAPLVGAAVMQKSMWDRIPVEARAHLKQAALKAGRAIQSRSRQENAEAIQAMKKRGLTVHAVSPQIEEAWLKMVGRIHGRIRGEIVPAAIFDEVMTLLEAFRKD